MKNFLLKIVLFLSILFACINIFCYAGEFLVNKYGVNFFQEKDFKLKIAIQRSKQKFQTQTVLLGNSVAGQIYGNTSDEKLYAITSTMAITLVGQYLLLENYIEANKNNLPENVIIYESPTCFTSGPYNKFSYNIFLRNFYRNEYKKELSPLAIENIKQFDYYCFAPYIWYRNMSFIPNNKITDTHNVIVEPATLEYFYKICNLCKKYNLKLSFEAIPFRESRKEEIYDYIYSFPIKNDAILNEFFSSVCFMSDSLYNSEMHFYNDKIPKDVLHIYK